MKALLPSLEALVVFLFSRIYGMMPVFWPKYQYSRKP
jgi:hypothetical protein